MTTSEIIDAQASCIDMLSKCVDGLFQQLSQHVTVEELDEMPEISIINEAVNLQQSIKKDADVQQFNANIADVQQDERRRERGNIDDIRNSMYSRFIGSSYH